MQKISIRLSEKTLSTLCEKYNLSNNKVPSSTIRKCLDDAINTQTLAGGKKHRRLSPQETLRTVRATKLDNPSLYSLRISTDILEYLKKYYGTTNTSECIRCALYDFLNNTGKELVIKNNKKILFMLGQKNSQMLDWLNPIFNEATSTYNLTGYLEPFTGTANVILHTDNWESETINDFL